MPKFMRILILFILFFMLPLISAWGLSIGDKAPEFQLTTFKGDELNLEEILKKKSLMLFFWTTWCPRCKEEMSQINTLASKFDPQNITVLGINAAWNDSIRRAKAFQHKYDVIYPLAFDWGSRVTKQYQVLGVPTFYVIDKNGTVKYQGHSISDELKQALKKTIDN